MYGDINNTQNVCWTLTVLYIHIVTHQTRNTERGKNTTVTSVMLHYLKKLTCCGLVILWVLLWGGVGVGDSFCVALWLLILVTFLLTDQRLDESQVSSNILFPSLLLNIRITLYSHITITLLLHYYHFTPTLHLLPHYTLLPHYCHFIPTLLSFYSHITVTLLPHYCHFAPTLLSLYSHITDTLFPCHCHCTLILLTFYSHITGTLISLYCQSDITDPLLPYHYRCPPTLLTLYSHITDTLLPYYWHFVPIILLFCSHIYDTLLPSYCHFTPTLLTLYFQKCHFSPTVLSFYSHVTVALLPH